MSAAFVWRECAEGAVLAVVVAIVCALAPRLPARHRAMLWWIVSAKLLVGLLPIPAVTIAALPPNEPRGSAVAAPLAPYQALADASGARFPDRARTSETSVAAGIWGGCSALLVLSTFPGWLRARAWRRAGRAPRDPEALDAIARATRIAGLRRAPRVLEVEALKTPLVMGFFRPAVLLPEGAAARLGREGLAMVLAHELAHVARGDLWLGLVPAMTRRVFFFHPAAWFAEREYAIAREAACDEAVLGAGGADAFEYGCLLLRLAAPVPASAALPISPRTMLRRRLEMIERLVRRVPHGARLGWTLIALAALAIVPVRLVAKETAGSSTYEVTSKHSAHRCLDVGSDADTAYVITSGDVRTMCGDMDDVRAADKARGRSPEVIWFRVGHESWVVRDPALLAEAHRLRQPIDTLAMEQERLGERQSDAGQEQAAVAARSYQDAQRLRQIEMERAARDARAAVEADSSAEGRAATGAGEARGGEAAELESERAVAEARAKDLAALDKHAAAELRARLEKVEAERRAEIAGHATGAWSVTPRQREEMAAELEALAQRQSALGGHQSELGEKQRALAGEMDARIEEMKRALGELLERAMKDGRAERVP